MSSKSVMKSVVKKVSKEIGKATAKTNRSGGRKSGDDYRYIDMKLPAVSPGIHTGSHLFEPPSGDPNDPYGYNQRSRITERSRFNPQFYPDTQFAGPIASAANS